MTRSPQHTTAPSITLREAREDDIGAILEIVQSAYRGEGGWTTESHLVRGARSTDSEVREMITDPAVTLIVAQGPDGPVGCCYTRTEGDRAELGLFAVHPAAQSGGIGGQLLEGQLEHLSGAGVRELMIQVLQSRPELHAWYERHGFRATGAELPFPANPALLTVPGLRMIEMVRQLQAS